MGRIRKTAAGKADPAEVDRKIQEERQRLPPNQCPLPERDDIRQNIENARSVAYRALTWELKSFHCR